MALLPNIDPTTGWIRFQRRFPVRISLDDVPEDVRLRVGANARVLAVYGW
jgi:multidrug resistance efflux pump